MRQHQWIRTRVEESFPVFCSHVTQTERRAGHPDRQGPFYAPGAEFFTIYDEKNLRWKEWAAEHLRNDGYTVSVDVVTR